MHLPCLHLLAVSSACLATQIATAANHPFLTAIPAATGAPVIVAGDTTYLEFGGYDWGPNWGGARRQTQTSATDQGATSVTTVTLAGSNATYTVTTAWSRPAPNTVRMESRLASQSDAALTLSIISLALGSHNGGSITVTAADGSATTHPVPLGRIQLGDAVKSIAMTDAVGATSTLTFDTPTPVVADNALRIVLASERITAGQHTDVAATLKLPAATDFYPDLAKVPPTNQGWFPFTGVSPIPPESEWSLARWLEAPAGKHGRIRAVNDQLIYNNRSIKLWGINVAFGATAPDRALADRRADFYAAMGINSVRLHKYADGDGWAGILRPGTGAAFEPAALDRMDYFVAALKQRGIYSKLSPVFIIKPGEDDRARIPYLDEFERTGNRYNPRHGSLYLSIELQDLLIDQLRALLTHRNPHTGLTYAKDPAIAYVELYNEDSSLFGGVTGVMARSATLRARGGAMFSAWLRRKYGTEEAFNAAWGPRGLNNSMLENQRIPRDESWAGNRIYPVGNPWFFDPTNLNTSQEAYRQRLLDTMLFLKELQDQVYARMAEAVRATGYEGEIIASNWHAGRQMSHFYNLHSDYLIGTIDRHNYFGGGARNAGPIQTASMFARPGGGSLSSSLNQVANRPFMLSEWIHVWPTEWGVEGPVILGAYGMGLQGWDVSYPFQNRDNGSFSPVVGAELWDATAPHFIGVFTAVSRQVHRGDVRESPIIHTRNVHIPSLAEQRVGFEEQTTQDGDIKSFDSDVFPTEALAIGRGVVAFTETFMPTEPLDVDSHKDANGLIRSVTGQLAWRPGQGQADGHIEIDTPGTQAVAGFAQNRTIELGAATITLRSRFAALYLSAQSPTGTLANDSILITAIARARNQNQVVLGDSFLASTGVVRNASNPPPVVMEPVVAEITLRRRGTPTVHILDHQGVRTGRTVPVENGILKLDTGRDGTPWYLITWR